VIAISKKKTLLGAAALGLLIVAGCASYGSKTTATAAKGQCWGVNACKGQGECAGKGHSCAGENSCKGKGYKMMAQADCDTAEGEFKKNM